MRLFLGFVFEVVVTGLLIDRGVNLPERMSHLIKGGEVQQLGKDITHAMKN